MDPGPARVRLERAMLTVRNRLLEDIDPAGHWTGELSSSALATATAITALSLVPPERTRPESAAAIRAGVGFLLETVNPDGGWGDTTKSFTNISTTMLARCALGFVAGRIPLEPVEAARLDAAVSRADAWIQRAGGIQAIKRRYGRDHTFSVPILTMGALCGRVDWREIPALPFELAVLPMGFFQFIRLPVVSYALPALIAIGQAIHHHRPSRNPLVRLIRERSRRRTLERLRLIQPESGGFLEATPLTAFVTMSLLSIGAVDHPVVTKGIEFLLRSRRADGGWPIDTNLATWVTTLSINALGEHLPAERVPPLRDWLLAQQGKTVHPYTMAAPGGWAWTDLTGGVPDADDTPGALLALAHLEVGARGEPGGGGKSCARSKRSEAESMVATPRDSPPSLPSPSRGEGSRRESGEPGEGFKASGGREPEAARAGIRWLLGLQNRDGGFPTFCRGWGALPFDRSAQDITAHALRAMLAWRPRLEPAIQRRIDSSVRRGFAYLRRTQRPDGSWLPLWFGNQRAPDDINPLYGTAKVLLAWRDAGQLSAREAVRGFAWLRSAQRADGGWAGFHPSAGAAPSSVEETALAVEALADDAAGAESHERGLAWLIERVERGTFTETAPIGFYFAKLWYHERLYPIIFTAAALARSLSSPRANGLPPSDRALPTR